MKKKIQCAVAGMLMMVATAAMAETALEQLGRIAGENMTPVSKHLDEAKLAAQQNPNLMIPREAQDVLKSCAEFNSLAFVSWTLPQAVAQTQTCLDKSYNQPGARRAYTVTAKAGKFAVRLCPQSANTFSCQAIAEVEGVIVAVNGRILTGDPVLMNLDFSLNKRKGLLLGWHAMLDDKAVISH